jgi:hypothetical protein
MRRLYARFRALPADEQRLLLALMAALPGIALLVRTRGVTGTVRLLERSSRGSGQRPADATDTHAAQRLAELASIAGRRGVLTATCLPQALLIEWILRRRGLSPELRVGVRKQADALDAHAWVELHGVALGQTELSHVPFPSRKLAGARR